MTVRSRSSRGGAPRATYSRWSRLPNRSRRRVAGPTSVASARGLVIAVADRDASSQTRLEASETGGERQASRRDDHRDVEIAQLRSALASRDVIGQAKGVLMVVHACSADEAFAMLRELSQRTNVKLRDVAARLVADRSGGQRPTGEVHADPAPRGRVDVRTPRSEQRDRAAH